MTKIYLACPYSSMEKESFVLVNDVSAHLMKQEYVVFSPISHSHCIAATANLPTTWEFWKLQDIPFIEWCEEVWIIDLGKERLARSKGVQEEIQIANSLNKPIKYVCPLTYLVQNEPIHDI